MKTTLEQQRFPVASDDHPLAAAVHAINRIWKRCFSPLWALGRGGSRDKFVKTLAP